MEERVQKAKGDLLKVEEVRTKSKAPLEDKLEKLNSKLVSAAEKKGEQVRRVATKLVDD